MKKILAGLFFAALWSSGSVATKLGLKVAQPLLILNMRFFIAAILMLFIALWINKDRMPKRYEWQPLIVCGLLNMAIYSTVFIFAMKYVTAGIGTLATASCPLIISILNAVWMRQKIAWNIWMGLFLGLCGVAAAIYPLLLNAYATPMGIILISLSMLCYSIGTVYYQSINWSLSRLSINGWHVLFGGLILLPFTTYSFDTNQNNFDTTFWYSVFWLVIPVSILSGQLWLYLLKIEPTRASLWIFLCPIFGFLYAFILTNEPITVYTVVGTVLVIGGLYLGKKNFAA